MRNEVGNEGEKNALILISALKACVLAVGLVAFVFMYTPMMEWLIDIVRLSPSILFCFVVAVSLLIGCLVISVWLIRSRAAFWKWLVLFVLILFFGSTSGLYGAFYYFSKEEKKGCITKDCAWFD